MVFGLKNIALAGGAIKGLSSNKITNTIGNPLVMCMIVVVILLLYTVTIVLLLGNNNGSLSDANWKVLIGMTIVLVLGVPIVMGVYEYSRCDSLKSLHSTEPKSVVGGDSLFSMGVSSSLMNNNPRPRQPDLFSAPRDTNPIRYDSRTNEMHKMDKFQPRNTPRLSQIDDLDTYWKADSNSIKNFDIFD